jgi:hypothetical protein
VQYPRDEAAIREFNIQCSDWWEDLAEKEKDKFEILADRSKGPNAEAKPAGAGEKSKDGILVSFLLTTTVRSLSPSHKIYRIGAGCSAAEHQTSTMLLLRPRRPIVAVRSQSRCQGGKRDLDAERRRGVRVLDAKFLTPDVDEKGRRQHYRSDEKSKFSPPDVYKEQR